MGLTGWPFAVLVAVLCAGSVGAAVTWWPGGRGRRTATVLQRALLVVTCQLTAVLLVAVLVNDHFTFYESWGDLLGNDQVQGTPVTADPSEGSHAGPGAPVVHVAPLPGNGRLREETVRGPRSGITARVWVLLPPGYDDPAAASKRYPVVMFLPGYPGQPSTWLHALDLQQQMDAAISSGRAHPFIAVLPTMNVASPRDTECVDVPKGPQVATWLGQDVPDVVAAQTRALPPGRAWAVTGYSTGGFCAAKLVLTRPQVFGSAAVLSGYFSPQSDLTTGDLFGGDQALKDANDPLWLVAHKPVPPARMLVVWSPKDPEIVGSDQAFLAAVRPPLTVEEIHLARGGHNTDVWLAVLPQVLHWLSTSTGP